LNASKEPNFASIAFATSPTGVLEPPGAITSQNSVWLACPPPLLRTAVCLSAGRASRFAIKSLMSFSANSVPSTAAFKFVT